MIGHIIITIESRLLSFSLCHYMVQFIYLSRHVITFRLAHHFLLLSPYSEILIQKLQLYHILYIYIYIFTAFEPAFSLSPRHFYAIISFPSHFREPLQFSLISPPPIAVIATLQPSLLPPYLYQYADHAFSHLLNSRESSLLSLSSSLLSFSHFHEIIISQLSFFS